MEKKTIKITVTPKRYAVSVDTHSVNTRTNRIEVTTDPGIDSLRTSANHNGVSTSDKDLARLVDKYANLPNYTIKVSHDGETFVSVKDLPGRDNETVKDRFLRWLRRIG